MIRGGHGGRRSRPQLDDSVQLHPEDNMFDTPTSSSRSCYNDLRNTLGHRQDLSYGHGPRPHGRYYGRRANRANYPYSRDNSGSTRRLVSPKHKNPHAKYDLKFCIEANQLDDLSPGDIEKLQKLLDRKKSREQQRQQHQAASNNRYVYMESGRRPIVPYTGPVPDVKKLLTENRFARLADLVVPLEVLGETDFVRHIHAQFENLSRDEMDELVLARTVAINSAPSLFSILLMAEETCSYFSAIDRLDIPVNPYDPYASTLSALKHATFSKLNVAKLSCMMSNGERPPSASSDYDFLKKIASGNGATVKSFSRSSESTVAPFPAATKQVPDISDIREFDFETFRHPFQKVICFLATIEKVISEIKGHRAPGCIAGGPINPKDRSRYIRDYDKQGIMRRYKDGCIIGLVKQGFCEHACNDNACRRRCKFALSVPYNLGMVFCPPTENSSVEDMDAYFERNRCPTRNGSFDDSRSATSGDGSSCSSAHKVTTPTDGVMMPEFPFSDQTDTSNNGTVRFSERRVSSSSKHRRRSNKHISPLDRPNDYHYQKNQPTPSDEKRYYHGSGSSSTEAVSTASAPLTGSAANQHPQHCGGQSGSDTGVISRGEGRHHGSHNGIPDFVSRSPVTTPPEVFSPERRSSEERSSSDQRRKSPLSRSASATSGGSKRRSFVDSPPRHESEDEDEDSDSSSSEAQKDRFKKRSGSRSNTPPSSPSKPDSAPAASASPGGDGGNDSDDGATEKGVTSNAKESVRVSERFETGDKSPTFIETEDESDDEDDQMSITSYDHSESSSAESGSETDGEDGESDMTL
ncbi:mRNA transactivator/RNA splicing transport regulator [Elephant endotheliotropic herpesvirus 1A]|nr:mRNA transactivator/RNA splicing transport regulator [Elephant endotheliotropic herpesvirus 1A]QOE74575.1 mRNA transactivator/RNA splicing transport regulator [Elephant endotheliotropic herpesvirus 1A]QOE74692.1 mRNA transactivator/RNA splicing transport regulator [Elephant endotheliotropic herpesvirus 1A]QOE74812.1 mRNA transactivator/RNA splicing transport regulator [Elephant endotheliotropic herpesvirus 1A]QOE74928.1 mRNA transactivatorRNA splicing transport regulator [Elephant endothelio